MAAQRGDLVALDAWISRSQDEVQRLCAYCVGRDRADELTREVYRRAYEELAAFHGESQARPWLLSIAFRTCVDSSRSRSPGGEPERDGRPFVEAILMCL